MRSKPVIPFLVLALALIAGFYFLRHGSSGFEPRQPGSPTIASSIAPVDLAQDSASSAIVPAAPVNSSETNDSELLIRGTVAEHQTYVEKRVAELQDLAMDDDPKSLNVILSELTNRDPEIRQAAVDAAIQFGSRDAIPKLTDAAMQTDDAVERAQMLQAADYLKLPSYRETVGDLPVGKPANKNVRLLRAAPAGDPVDATRR